MILSNDLQNKSSIACIMYLYNICYFWIYIILFIFRLMIFQKSLWFKIETLGFETCKIFCNFVEIWMIKNFVGISKLVY